MPDVFTARRLRDLRNDALVFAAEHDHWLSCEEADAELDAVKRTALRQRVIEAALLWRPKDPSRAEIDLLYGMAREAARIALARRSAAFQCAYGLTLSCGIEETPAGTDAPAKES